MVKQSAGSKSRRPKNLDLQRQPAAPAALAEAVTSAAAAASAAAPALSQNWARLKQHLSLTKRPAAAQGAAAAAPAPPAAAPAARPPAAPAGAAGAGAAAGAAARAAAAAAVAAADPLQAAIRAAARAALLGPFAPDAELSGEQRQYVALDCEMVGVGPSGERSALAQVVAVDWLGRVLLNKYVRPAEPVTDYRTHVSGCTAALLRGAEPLAPVQAEVAALLRAKVLVGHGLQNDLKALLLSHPAASTRDTARYRPFMYTRGDGKWNPKRLKHLVHQHLQIDIQREGAAHEPAEDARGALALYRLHRREWEHSLIAARAGRTATKKAKKPSAAR
jgi:RNA exonuclease 4